MTNDEIRLLTAEQVNEEVTKRLGYHKAHGRMDAASLSDQTFWLGPDGVTSVLPDYTQDIKLAWVLFRNLCVFEARIAFFETPHNRWTCTAVKKSGREVVTFAETEFLAICKCWLMMIESFVNR